MATASATWGKSLKSWDMGLRGVMSSPLGATIILSPVLSAERMFVQNFFVAVND